MTAVSSAVASIIDMFSSVFEFVMDTPILLCLIAIPIVGSIIWVVTSLFRK